MGGYTGGTPADEGVEPAVEVTARLVPVEFEATAAAAWRPAAYLGMRPGSP